MADRILRGDAVVVQQVTTLTPTAANAALYDLLVNGKTTDGYTSDASGTVQEIVEGLKTALAANAKGIPEITEITFTENDTTLIATGPTTGKPFTLTEGPGGGNFASIAATTDAKSPNHWIAENFTGVTLPATGDSVYVQGSSQSIKWGLDQNTVTLALLDVRMDYTGQIGLPELNQDSSTAYYEYRDTHLKISATALRIGLGDGTGSGRLKFDTGSNACDCTVFNTGAPADQDEGSVHLVGSHASNALQVFRGTVDIAMLPGYTAQWPVIVASGGTVRCGIGTTLGAVTAAGNSTIKTQSAVTTWATRDNGKGEHSFAGNIGTADIQGGPLKIRSTAALTISQLNGYGGKTLDLTECDSNVTVTAATIYATPESPFTILDPNNKLVMTNAASTPNGAQSLRVVTGSGRNVRIT